MKKLTLLAVATLFLVSVFAQQMKYSKVKILTDDMGLQKLAHAGLDVSEGTFKKGEFFVSDFSELEIAKMQELNVNYEILIDDVAKFYMERNIGKSNDVNDYKGMDEWEVPENFDFGSMGGHYTFEEMVAHIDNMANLFPDLVTVKESIGQSIEGRDLWMVKISDNPNVNEDEPEVLYTALHHAREPASLMQMIYYMYYLLENYDNDDLIKTLVDNTEMYFVPVVNPDGYVYNATTNPNGGGMWRKNRRNNGDGTFGVDPNRNYAYQWGYDNNGSSPYTDSETYRGTAPFSEPETQAMRDFVNDHEFRLALNYHTYSNLLLYPWGWTSDLSPDEDIMNAYAALMTQDNNYTYGPSSTTIYPTNGDANDWMYGEQTSKDKIFSYTPELGGSSDGFYCPIDRIIPIAQENMIQNILLAAFAGKYGEINDLTSGIISETNGFISFDVTRLGLVDGTYTVSLEAANNAVASTGDALEFTAMELLDTNTDSISYNLAAGISSGTIVKFVLSIDNGDYVLSDTLTKIYGNPVVVFEDDGNTLDNWSGNWAVTNASYHSPTGSITDSPNGNYNDQSTYTVTMDNPIDLTTAGYAQLSFWAKWEIEAGWDYTQILISTNNGLSWTPMQGKYTVAGNSNQPTGEPLYDGFQTQWVQEEIDLTEFLGNEVKFRFQLVSDQSVNEDGYYFDDFTITTVDIATGIIDNNRAKQISISNPIPNPAKGTVRFNLWNTDEMTASRFAVYNTAGQKVYSRNLSNNPSQLSISINAWKSGVYYYRIESANGNTETNKLMVY
ncbi:MAG: T9SS type A sorting domain-containing protein [Chlorobi bacterium]|nr:T9SS type A sorting domain-containing protein [Chlorobiota bacterium]